MGWLAFLVVLLSINYVSIRGAEVTYDARSLIIDGQRKILFSGSIHYPRSTPDMWPDLIRKGKEGGLDVIETYVFWNVHEPQPGQYDFSGRYDLVKFIKEIQAQGLYACLRIGPFIQAEWNYGGLPYWLHDVPGVVYRTDNLLFKYYMEEFVTKIVNLMKSEGLFASQGGPIILSQIENEYGNIESAFGADGPKYVNWAAKMAVGLNTGVPWVMCKQQDAPDPVINTCNGMRCGETFAGPNSPTKPSLWTENWTSFLQKWGDGPYKRDAEDIAFQVALWIAKNGSFVNYYMYHGGTNLGRTSAGYMVTTYYDQAPLDEYGLKFQNKYGHLKDLHAAVKMCAKPLLHGKQMISSMGEFQQAFVFQEEDEACVAFLLNDDIAKATVQFRNASFELPPKSISILGDCKNEIYNTAKVTAEYNEKIVTTIETFNAAERWEVYKDEVPNYDDTSLKLRTILEQTNTTKDKTDYLWYTLSYTSNSVCTNSELSVTSLSHVSHAFVNGKYIGGAHSSHNATGAITSNYPMQLSEGSNNISILSGLVGLPDSGAHVERRYMGIKGVEIKCNRETRDNIRDYKWGYQVGLKGEGLKIYSDEKLGNVEWSKMSNSTGEPLTWYKTMFNGPLGNDPVALNLSSMGKGEVWVNGQSIGRYWISFHTVDGIPSQVLYHIPRSFLKPLGNSLILFEEEGGNPLKISLNTIQVKTSRDSLPQKN